MWAVPVGLSLAILATEALADAPVASAQVRRNKATHIVVGKVSRVYSAAGPVQDARREVFLVAEIAVESVEKGDGVAPGETLFARYWRADWLGNSTAFAPPGATTCIFPRPEPGDSVRAYLGLNQENGLGTRSGRGFNVLFPNGFEILGSHAQRGSHPPRLSTPPAPE